MGYEEEFSKFLLALISDVDRRIRRGEQRLVLNNQPNPVRIMHNTITCFAVDVLLFFLNSFFLLIICSPTCGFSIFSADDLILMFLMESKSLKVNIRKIQIMIFLPEQSR